MGWGKFIGTAGLFGAYILKIKYEKKAQIYIAKL